MDLTTSSTPDLAYALNFSASLKSFATANFKASYDPSVTFRAASLNLFALSNAWSLSSLAFLIS
jgi:hypothetical protein